MKFVVIFIILVAMILFYFLYKLYEWGEAREWFDDHKNARAFRKHFAGEGIQTNVQFNDEVMITFLHKGTYYSQTIPLLKAKEFYETTQDGGIRKTLVNYFTK